MRVSCHSGEDVRMTTDDEVLEAARRLSETLRPGALDETLAQVTAAAVELLPGVEFASITVAYSDGRLETVAPTAELITHLDAAQYELREGPCYDSATETLHVTAPDIGNDPRFRRYGPVAANAGIGAQAAVRLFEGPHSNGALNLYSRRVGDLADIGVLHELFAHQSATALAYAREITQLKDVIATRQLIGQAVGVTMERFNLDEARAFSFLTRLSQDSNVKLRTLAEQLIAATVAAQGRAD
jgi:GAF domain-containing protein